MKTLNLHSSGPEVKLWQEFLINNNYVIGTADGVFGRKIKNATIEFQFFEHLSSNGIIDDCSYKKAYKMGLILSNQSNEETITDTYLPSPPLFSCLNMSQRKSLFGNFEYRIINEPGSIEILGNWVKENITTINIPQLKTVKADSGLFSGNIRWHKKVVDQIKGFYNELVNKKMIKLVLTWGSSFVPRTVRGRPNTLSNHAFGTAFDINALWNPLNAVPTLYGKKESVREIVPIANDHGFYWGGHYHTRKDGMHFEIAKLL